MGGPPARTRCVRSDTSCLHRDISSLGRSRLSAHSSLQHRDGQLLLPWFAAPHPKGCAPLSKHRGTALRSLVSLWCDPTPGVPRRAHAAQPAATAASHPSQLNLTALTLGRTGKTWSSSLLRGEGAHTQPQRALRTIHGQRHLAQTLQHFFFESSKSTYPGFILKHSQEINRSIGSLLQSWY